MAPTEWWTVTEEGNPLFGFDVKGVRREVDDIYYLDLTGLRRPTTQVGDRPMQFMSPVPFGVLVLLRHLSPAAVQENVMQFSFQRDEIYGPFVREERRTLPDGNEVQYVLFKEAVQVALHKGGMLQRSETVHFADDAKDAIERWVDSIVTSADIRSANKRFEEML